MSNHAAPAVPEPSTVKPRALSVAGAAAYLSLATSTLDNWRSQGIGPRYHRIGRAIRYDVADLDAWFDEYRVGGVK